MEHPSQDQPRRDGAKRRLRQRWYFWATIIAVIAAAVALGPTLLGVTPLRNYLARKITRIEHGTATVEELRLRWFSPPRIRGLRLMTTDGQPLVEVSEATGDTPLWRWLVGLSELGHFRVENPRVSLSIDADGRSNFSRAFARPDEESVEQEPSSLPAEISASWEIVDGWFQFQAEPERPEWTIGPLNVATSLEHTEKQPAASWLVVQPGMMLDRLGLTEEICNDMLKFAAPVLADTSWAKGQVSLELHSCRLPLDELSTGHIEGTLTIHSVEVGATRLVQEILAGIGVPVAMELIDDSRVHFTMAEGRVRHDGLRFQIGDVTVETSGVVGLDESLDMVAEITLPEIQQAQTRIGSAIDRRKIRVPVEGTLQDPRVASKELLAQGEDLVRELLPELEEDSAEAWLELLREFVARRRQASDEEPTDDSPGDFESDDRPILKNLRDRLRGRLALEKEPSTVPDESLGEEQESAEDERDPRRPVRDMLKRRRERRP